MPGPADAPTARSGRAARLGRALASPVGVLLTVPALVLAVGLGILVLGRDATRDTSETLARQQLAAQAREIEAQVALALDQAGPLLERLRALADPTRARDEVLVRLHDLVVGRPGVAYVSISFPDGTFRGAYLGDGGRVEAQESRVGAAGTEVARFVVERDRLAPAAREVTAYDPRTRPFYALAVRTRGRAWTTPYPFFRSWQTGISCTEPVYDAAGALAAVLTVDFDVAALSSYLARAALPGARSLVFTRDGTILAYPAATPPPPPDREALLRHTDLADPALAALIEAPALGAGGLAFVELTAAGGAYLASVAPIGGARAGVPVPLDWYVATLVPADTLLGPTRGLVRRSVLASGAAVAAAVALALVLAWNLVRMRRQVAASRAEARTATARARELGAYRLVARVGQGGMGEVWRAEHRLLARAAAIKLIRPEALADPAGGEELRARFHREARTLASLRSRHTIAVFDYGVAEDGAFYYVMELLDGLDLEALVVRHGPQPPARVIDLLVQACASLAEAHDAGLLHRDIKPPNLFVSRAADEVEIVKLLDFGIVLTAGEPPPAPSGPPGRGPSAAALLETPRLTQAGAMLGTPGFMAPEQILGMALDGRADLYALACVAWWLLTAREVFPREGSDGARLLRHHMLDEVPALAPLVPGWCPPALEDVLRACLAKDAADRPADARQLAARLRAIAIPPEHAWTEDRARAWWATHQPAAPAASAMPGEEAVAEVRVAAGAR